MIIQNMCMLELHVFLHSIKAYPPAVPGVPDPNLKYKNQSFISHFGCTLIHFVASERET